VNLATNLNQKIGLMGGIIFKTLIPQAKPLAGFKEQTHERINPRHPHRHCYRHWLCSPLSLMVVNMIIPNPDFPSNPPAFPNEVGYKHQQGGMTLRDYFAAKAMQSLLRQYPDHLMNSPANEVACDAYILADAMLKAREE